MMSFDQICSCCGSTGGIIQVDRIAHWEKVARDAGRAEADAEIAALKGAQCHPAACRDEKLWREEIAKVKAENTRLDAEWKQAHQTNSDLLTERFQLKAERDGLREALQDAVTILNVSVSRTPRFPRSWIDRANKLLSAPASRQPTETLIDDPRSPDGKSVTGGDND